MSHQFIKNRDIILFSFLPWNSIIAFNLKDLAFELSRYNRVLFVDRASDRGTIFKSKFSVKQDPPVFLQKIESVQDNLWVLHPASVMESGNWSPTYKIFDFFNRINNKRLAIDINEVITSLGFKNTIFFNDNDFFRGQYLKTLLPVSEYIFYIRDFLTIQPYFVKFGLRCEKDVISRADLVVANSQWLAEYAAKWNPNSTNIGQGCNLSDYNLDPIPEPIDLKAIPKPIIGYFGAVSGMRLDEDLLVEIAASLPEMSLVMVGPSDRQFNESSLRSKGNVYFLGAKRPEQTAAYISHFTVCINPQKLNQLTIGNYPRKIDEYLAAGKPVIATETHAMEMFRNHIILCKTPEEYILSIRKMINDPIWFSEELKYRRREFAMTHSWENVAGALGEAYYLMMKNNPRNA